MLELLQNFLQPVLDFVPRVSHRPAANEFCVIDGPLGVRETKWPVLHAPILTHVEYYPINPVAVDLEIQTLTTADPVELTLNATTTIVVEDPISLRMQCGSDHWVAIAAVAMRAEISRLAVENTKEHFVELIRSGELEDAISQKLFSETRGSLSVNSFAVEDCAATSSFRIYGVAGVV